MKNSLHCVTQHPRYQSGMVTTFTGVMILVLLTLMMFFAIRVGVFEQRVSSNEMRQKAAFHAAESGISHAKEFLKENTGLIASMIVQDSGQTGWLSTTGGRWESCAAWAKKAKPEGLGSLQDLETPPENLSEDLKQHPCFGGYIPEERKYLYYYNFDGSRNLPVSTDTILADNTRQVSVEALLCVLDVVVDATEPVPVKGCYLHPDHDPGGSVSQEPVGTAGSGRYMITLLARGEADCVNGDCASEALIGEQVSSFGAAAGGNAPLVPLTTKNSFPPSGSAEVIPNPNAGGVGVPVSVWMNANSSCSGDSVADPSSGSWATCEMHEWYGANSMPSDQKCPGNCSCEQAESISYTHSNEDILGIDLVADSLFPCDLFQFYFGVPSADYATVKGYSKIIDDCSILGPGSAGIYWVTGEECRINANTQVGSLEAPVMLISAATTTRLNGGAEIFGTVFVTDVEKPDAKLHSNGTNTVYGSVIVDAVLDSYQGTFQVVWNENVVNKAPGTGGLGAVLGGWTDFHLDWE